MMDVTALGLVDLVDVWEQGCASRSATRVFLLLSRACADMSAQELAALPVGVRNALLLQLREQIFGPELKSVVSCPRCHEALEITLDVRDLRLRHEMREAPTEWTHGDLAVRFRVPTSGDLVSLEECEKYEEARRCLIERCVLEAHRNGKALKPELLTDEETTALADHVAQADPGAEITLNGDCSHCRHRWESLLDIALFLWCELDMHIKRLLTEVHALAWAYGWSERDILAMSTRRRQIYLELLG